MTIIVLLSQFCETSPLPRTDQTQIRHKLLKTRSLHELGHNPLNSSRNYPWPFGFALIFITLFKFISSSLRRTHVNGHRKVQRSHFSIYYKPICIFESFLVIKMSHRFCFPVGVFEFMVAIALRHIRRWWYFGHKSIDLHIFGARRSFNWYDVSNIKIRQFF